MPGLPGKNLLDIVDRGAILPHNVVKRGPLVPTFHEFRVTFDNRIEPDQRGL